MNRRISNREMSNIEGRRKKAVGNRHEAIGSGQAVRKKATRVIWKQEPKAGISGKHINRS